MNHPTGGLGGRVVSYFHANKLFGHHNDIEDVLQGRGNGSSSPTLPLYSLQKQVPLLQVWGLGERFSSHSGSGRNPAAKQYLVNFRLKISPLVATIFRSFSGNESPNWGTIYMVIFFGPQIQPHSCSQYTSMAVFVGVRGLLLHKMAVTPSRISKHRWWVDCI